MAPIQCTRCGAVVASYDESPVPATARAIVRGYLGRVDVQCANCRPVAAAQPIKRL